MSKKFTYLLPLNVLQIEKRVSIVSRSGKFQDFTLIELLVIIAILFPVFTKVCEKARQITCASNMNQLGLGFIRGSQDNDGLPTGHNMGSVPGSEANWTFAIYPYVKSPNVYHCPDDTQTGTPSYAYNYNVPQGLDPMFDSSRAGRAVKKENV